MNYRCGRFDVMAQLVEHIVHIDGVTGSSPVATTIIPRISGFEGFFMFSWTFGNRPRKKYRDGAGPGLKKQGPSCILYLAFR